MMRQSPDEIRWVTSHSLMIWDSSYPQKLIPAIHITVCTTATNDKDARLLLSSLGVPFYGKHVN